MNDYIKVSTPQDDNHFPALTKEDQRAILQWIQSRLYPRKTPNNWHTSYGLKHLLERDTKIYLTNNQFKEAMLMCGFTPVNPRELNWCFRLSSKSPAFQLRIW